MHSSASSPLDARVAPGFAAPAAARPCPATPASSAPRLRPASPAAHGAADQSVSRQSRSNRSLAIPPARPTAAAERPPVCLASHVRVSAASIQPVVHPGVPTPRLRTPPPLCPKRRQIADRLNRSRCKLHFGFPEASGQTAVSRTSLTHRKNQSGLGSARPCLAPFATPLVE